MKDAKNSQNITWQHIALTVLCVVLALILFAIVGLTIYANHLLGLITDNGDGYLRFNIGCPRRYVIDAVERLAKAINELDTKD